jgi:hypothetical protein
VLTLPHGKKTIVSLRRSLRSSHCCPQFLTLHSAVTLERQSSCSAPTLCSLQTSTKISRPYLLLVKTTHLILSLRCISVGTRKGYSITNCDPFGRVYTMSACVIYPWVTLSGLSLIPLPKNIDDGARGIVEMLFCTSLIALVGAADQPSSSPRKLQIVNTKVRRYHQPSAIISSNPSRSGNP